MKQEITFTTLTMSFLIAVALNVAPSQCYNFTYTGYKVLRVHPQSENQMKAIKNLKNDIQSIDFWSELRDFNQTVDIMVSPRELSRAMDHFRDSQVHFEVTIEDVQRLIDEENVDEQTARAARIWLVARNGKMSWTKYHRLADIYAYMNEVEKDFQNVAQVITVGHTYQKRPINLIKLGIPGSVKKPAIWIDGGIHAREWISPATATYFIEQLMTGYQNGNQQITNYLERLDWYILPVMNPDGYEYSHTGSRMWRKNRSLTTGIFCRGVDLNRNFGFKWNTGGASNRPCAENFAGPNAFSEQETKSVANFIRSKNGIFKAFVTLHSYGQFWMTPWGYTAKLPDDYQDLVTVASHGADAIQSVHGTKYTIGSSTNMLYVASGGSDDWAKGSAGIKYSYSMELRDTGRYGFLLPSSQIVPTGKETWEGIKVVADAIISTIK